MRWPQSHYLEGVQGRLLVLTSCSLKKHMMVSTCFSDVERLWFSLGFGPPFATDNTTDIPKFKSAGGGVLQNSSLKVVELRIFEL